MKISNVLSAVSGGLFAVALIVACGTAGDARPVTVSTEVVYVRGYYVKRFKFRDGLECVIVQGGVTCNWEARK